MFKRLLVPLDQSSFAEQAVGTAAAIARSSGAIVDLTFVFDPQRSGLKLPKRHLANERSYLGSVADDLHATAGVVATHSLLVGDAVEMICARALAVGADLIVMTAHGCGGPARAEMGSVADGVLRRSGLPVLMLRPKEEQGPWTFSWPAIRKVLVPLDGSELASGIQCVAARLARSCKARLLLLQVVQPAPLASMDLETPHLGSRPAWNDAVTQLLMDEAEQHLAACAAMLDDQGIGNTEIEVVLADHVAGGITTFARRHDVDIVAMSTHGRGASRRALGSVVEEVRRDCEAPALLCRPKGVPEDAGHLRATSVEGHQPALAHA